MLSLLDDQLRSSVIIDEWTHDIMMTLRIANSNRATSYIQNIGCFYQVSMSKYLIVQTNRAGGHS